VFQRSSDASIKSASERIGGGVIGARGQHTEDREDLVTSIMTRTLHDLLAVIALDQQFAEIFNEGACALVEVGTAPIWSD
jgi:hypothetical protein